ncbi:MAG: tRNA (adenosine(37)-N6)-dimethylallyltransferase MiaA [Thermoanaerobaculia bacterium]
MPQVIAIVGPTASGKSALALALAEALGGEIVNADALQVYRGFDIGTAKPTPAEQRRIPHHLIDILDPGERYSAGEFARRARAALAAIAASGRTAILVGGSGLYLRALWSGIAPLPPVDTEVRGRLLERLDGEGLASLFADLSRLDPATAARLGAGDTQRILRALEVALATGEALSSWIARQPFGAEPVAMRKVGLTLPRGLLYDAIAARVQSMVGAGWLEEVRALLARGVDRSSPAFQAIGYRQWVGFLDGEVSFDASLQQVVTSTKRFAKRQETWFRREEGIEWWDARRTRDCLTSMIEMPAVAGGEPEKIAGIAVPTGAPGGGG